MLMDGIKNKGHNRVIVMAGSGIWGFGIWGLEVDFVGILMG